MWRGNQTSYHLTNWRRETYRAACCDCGLVHDLRFGVRGNRLVIRVRRNNRATGQIRRWHGLACRKQNGCRGRPHA